jgi:hypothetical protein
MFLPGVSSQVLVWAIRPELSAAGVDDVLTDTPLELRVQGRDLIPSMAIGKRRGNPQSRRPALRRPMIANRLFWRHSLQITTLRSYAGRMARPALPWSKFTTSGLDGRPRACHALWALRSAVASAVLSRLEQDLKLDALRTAHATTLVVRPRLLCNLRPLLG